MTTTDYGKLWNSISEYAAPPFFNFAPQYQDITSMYQSELQKQRGPPVPPEVVYKERALGSMFKIAVIATILFIVLSHNMAYAIINSVYSTVTGTHSELVSEETGCPTLRGIMFNAGLFFICMSVTLF